MARTKKVSKTAFATGVTLLVATLVWLLVAVPALVKFPTDVESSPEYEGTFRLYVNPLTMQTLASPSELPLTVSRHVEAVASESSSSRVVLRETIAQKAGDLVDTTQRNQYVMDRSTLENVDDPRAWAFTPDNVVDRSGTYRLNLPFGTDADREYPIYRNEIGDTYAMQPRADGEREVEGLSVLPFRGEVTNVPFTDAYMSELRRSLPLPDTTAFEALKPRLAAAGFDVDAVVAKLRAVATPAEHAVIDTMLAATFPLEYVLAFEGTAAVEPTTGAQVRVGSSDTYSVRPAIDPQSWSEFIAVAMKYEAQVPEAAAVDDALDEVRETLIPLANFEYEQTPASVAESVDDVKESRRSILLAKQWIPAALAFLGGLALLVGAWEWPRRPRGRRPARVPARRPVEA